MRSILKSVAMVAMVAGTAVAGTGCEKTREQLQPDVNDIDQTGQQGQKEPPAPAKPQAGENDRQIRQLEKKVVEPTMLCRCQKMGDRENRQHDHQCGPPRCRPADSSEIEA